MKRALLLVLTILILVGHTAADPIRIWTDNQEYVFPAGFEARIPLHVENSAGGEVSGVLRAVLTEIIDGKETGQRTESRSYAFSPGESTIVFPAGTSEAPLIRQVRLNFDYTAGMARTLTLEELTIRFVTTDSGSSSPSASGPVLEAVPGVVQTNSIGATGPVQPSGAADLLMTGQVTQDIGSLQRELEASQQETRQEEESLHQRLVQDPVFNSLNETLASGGYTATDPVIEQGSATDGQFSIQYTGNGGTALLQGTMERGIVTSMNASSPTSLPVPPEFTNDERYRDQMTQLVEQGYTPSGSRIGIAGNEITLESEFNGKDGTRALLTARVKNGVVQSVGVERDQGLIDYPSLVALLVLIAVLGLLLAMNRGRGSGTLEAQEQDIRVVKNSQDSTAVALEMIRGARELASGDNLPAAYRKAGYALRYFISHRYGTGDEITDTDAIALIGKFQSPHLSRISPILQRCREVGYAREATTPEEFRELVQGLTELIGDIETTGVTGPGTISPPSPDPHPDPARNRRR